MKFHQKSEDQIKRKRLWTPSRREVLMFFLFISPGLIGFCLFSIYPIFRSFILSFTNRSLLGFDDTSFVGFKNYIRAFSDPYVIEGLKTSLIYMLLTTVIVNVVGLGAALLMHSIKSKKTSAGFRTAFYVPSILPAVSLVIMFSWIFNPASGIINSILSMMGVDTSGLLWFLGTDSALWTLILTSFWAFGGKMVIYLSARQGISKDFYEAAEMDGVSKWKQFLKITLPLLSPVIFYNVLMSIIGGLQVFTEAYVLSGTGAGAPIRFFVLNLYSVAFGNTYQLGYASAQAWILFFITLGFSILYFVVAKKILNLEEDKKVKAKHERKHI